MTLSAPANTQGLVSNQYQQTWTRLIFIALGVLYVWWHGSLFSALSAVSIYIIWQIYTFIDTPRRPLSTTRFLISPILDALLIALGIILDNVAYASAIQLSLDIPLLILQILSLILLPYYIYIINKHAKSSASAKKQAQNISFDILNRSPIPIFTFQKSDTGAPRITYANTAIQAIYRDDLEMIEACQDGLLDTCNKPSPFYVRGRNINNQKIQLMGQTSSFHLQGKTTGICFLIDITQSESIHSDMEKNMHEAHVSTLIAGITHDFRNVLTSIIGSAEVMQFTVKDQNIIDLLRLIIDAGEHGSEIVSNILAQNMPAEAVDSTDKQATYQSLTSMLNLIRIQLPSHIQLCLHLEEQLPAANINLTIPPNLCIKQGVLIYIYGQTFIIS